jgi:sugar lactone lactonase YvrE/uncharacterized protein GlcG (DUF336 family)
MSTLTLIRNSRQLTYAAAAIAIEAAVAKSRELAAPECIAVVDAGGNLLAFARVDGAAVLARDPAIAKAATSASLGGPTGGIPFEFGANLGLASHGGIVNLGGGLPIVFQGTVLGGDRRRVGKHRAGRRRCRGRPRRRAGRARRLVSMTPRFARTPASTGIAIIVAAAAAFGPATAVAQNSGDTQLPSSTSSASGSTGRLASDRSIGWIEPVFEFREAMPTGVTVAAGGRIFVNFPRWGDAVPFTVGEIRDGRVIPYPDAAINRFDPARPGETLGSVQSVVVDPANRLWILDTAAPGFSAPVAGGAKLVAVDLATDKVVKTIVLSASTILPTTYINDVRFDLRRAKAGVAYITDSSVSGPGGIIVVDLDSGESWRKLTGHPSTSPDPAFIPVVEGERLAVREQGKPPAPFNVASDGIAISADGATLYYCPLSSRHLYSVPTALLLDRSAPEATVAAAVVDLGEKGASDGLEADDKGRVYAGDYERNSVRRRETDGEWTTIAHDPRILWPDTLSVASDGYLYFTANQLHRQAQFHEGRDLREKPYTLFRVKIDAGPVLLK